MATTASGLPYPVGTDKVVDGDNAIKALADALEPRTAKALTVEVAAISLNTNEAVMANIAVVPGTWDLFLTAWVDWSMTAPPRIYASLKAPGWIEVDGSQLFVNAGTGSGPIALSKTNLVVASAGTVDFAAYFAAGPTGSAAVKSIKFRAKRVL